MPRNLLCCLTLALFAAFGASAEITYDYTNTYFHAWSYVRDPQDATGGSKLQNLQSASPLLTYPLPLPSVGHATYAARGFTATGDVTVTKWVASSDEITLAGSAVASSNGGGLLASGYIDDRVDFYVTEASAFTLTGHLEAQGSAYHRIDLYSPNGGKFLVNVRDDGDFEYTGTLPAYSQFGGPNVMRVQVGWNDFAGPGTTPTANISATFRLVPEPASTSLLLATAAALNLRRPRRRFTR